MTWQPNYWNTSRRDYIWNSKAIVGKELSLSSWCIASLYIYHFSTVVDFSSEKYNVVLLDRVAPGTNREIYNEDNDGETWTQPLLRNDKYIMIRLLILIIFR